MPMALIHRHIRGRQSWRFVTIDGYARREQQRAENRGITNAVFTAVSYFIVRRPYAALSAPDVRPRHQHLLGSKRIT